VSDWRLAAYRAVRPLLFAADPEAIHHATLRALSIAAYGSLGRALCSFASGVEQTTPASGPVQLMGLRFRNRIGLGAGFDKDGVAIRGWAALGFGFVELGTVTPRPQPGNPKPRLVRLTVDEALINRMGFNNAGADALAARIRDARPDLPAGFIVGVNVGRNRDTPDERTVDDYVAAARSVADVADYLAVNVSSPNTPGLRDLQDPARLRELLDAVRAAAPGPPIVVKLSPDLEPDRFDALLAGLVDSPAAGIVVSNTTIGRSDLASADASEEGGLSGRPLRERTQAAVARAREVAGSRLAIIASGGIGADAPGVPAGADLAQLWTGMVYDGPGLIGQAVAVSRGDVSAPIALGDSGGSDVARHKDEYVGSATESEHPKR
jgi:dihydroorotate dehydrogenase